MWWWWWWFLFVVQICRQGAAEPIRSCWEIVKFSAAKVFPPPEQNWIYDGDDDDNVDDYDDDDGDGGDDDDDDDNDNGDDDAKGVPAS